MNRKKSNLIVRRQIMIQLTVGAGVSGEQVGTGVSSIITIDVCSTVGSSVGSGVGLSVGSSVTGALVGLSVGSSVTGAFVGSGVGDGVGSSVGASVGLHTSTTLQESSASSAPSMMISSAQHSVLVSKKFGPSISESYPLEHLVIPSMVMM